MKPLEGLLVFCNFRGITIESCFVNKSPCGAEGWGNRSIECQNTNGCEYWTWDPSMGLSIKILSKIRLFLIEILIEFYNNSAVMWFSDSNVHFEDSVHWQISSFPIGKGGWLHKFFKIFVASWARIAWSADLLIGILEEFWNYTLHGSGSEWKNEGRFLWQCFHI